MSIHLKYTIAILLSVFFSVIPTQTVPADQQTSKEKKSKKTKKKNSKKVVNRAIKSMTFDELKPAKEEYLKNGHKEYACSCLERMITLENDIHKQKDLRIELGNLYLDLGRHIKVSDTFGDFIRLYPNSPDTEYAHYQAIDALWNQTLSPDRDQTVTNETIKLIKKYLDTKQYEKFRPNVEKCKQQCYRKLIDHEEHVCRFYLNRGRYKGAQKRLDYIRNKYLELLPEYEQNLLTLECECAQKSNNNELFNQKTAELARRFPAEQPSKKLNKHRSHSKRF